MRLLITATILIVILLIIFQFVIALSCYLEVRDQYQVPVYQQTQELLTKLNQQASNCDQTFQPLSRFVHFLSEKAGINLPPYQEYEIHWGIPPKL